MRCIALLSKDYLRTLRGTDCDGQCRRIADYELDGLVMCSEHMSMRLLESAKAAGQIKAIPRTIADKELRRKVCAGS